jgi:DNA polymerase II small subunit/DNA polymerase delta subunit B
MKETIEFFLNHGKLLNPQAAETISNFDKSQLLKLLEYPEIVITPEHLQKLIQQSKKEMEIIFNISEKRALDQMEQLSVLNSRFAKIKEILMERLNKPFISINKANQIRNEIWLLGVIRSIEENEKGIRIDIEDPTGVAQVWFEKNPSCELDEIVAIRAKAVARILVGQDVWWPDVPLRSAKKGRGRICIISDLHLDEAPEDQFRRFLHWFGQEGADWLIVAGDFGGEEGFEIFHELFTENCPTKSAIIIPGEKDSKDQFPQLPLKSTKSNIHSFSNPSMLVIGGVNLLLIHSFNMRMLKTRIINSNVLLPNDPMIISVPPDIVCYGHTHQPYVHNYKAITCANGGSLLTSFKPVLIDLATRTWEQIT